MTRIMNSIPLTITRDSGVGAYDINGDWVDGATTEVPIKCSIQPFQKGTTMQVLPSGVMSEDALVIFTTTSIKTINQFDFLAADRAVIDNLNYIASSVANWSRHSLRTANYEVIFIREDKIPNGGV